MSDCWIKGCDSNARPEHDPCCSSHGHPLCCEHYERTHFCIGACERFPHESTDSGNG